MPTDEPRPIAPPAPPEDGTSQDTGDPADATRTVEVPGGVRPFRPAAFTPPGFTLPLAPAERTAIPGYEVLAKLGEGGMGVVYHARQTGTGRDVALKLMLGDADEPTRGLARFLAEAEAVAAVRHPHVVHVYEFGQHAGRPYLALEYLPGGTLADRLAAAGRLDAPDATRLVEKLARAVQAAHGVGIVHRDLKPANVLFDADGEPRVTDFGLAKRASTTLTATHTVMGSPAYMSPEQARGEAKFIGPAADVWGLGVILYECLAGARPFPGDSAAAVLRCVVAADPVPLPQAVPGVPRALELVCRKCLEKNPQDRYPSADDLADDLRRFAAGEPVHVRTPGPATRVVKWVRRDPARATAYTLTAAVVALIGVAAFVLDLWQRADRERVDAKANQERAEAAQVLAKDAQTRAETIQVQLAAEEAAARAEKQNAERARDEARKAEARADAARRAADAARDRAERFEYALAIGAAYRDWRAADLAAMRDRLRACPPDRRGWEWDYAHRLCHAERLALSGDRPLVAAVYSPDGTRVATAEAGGAVRVWDAVGGGAVLTIGGDGADVRSVAYSRDGTRLVTAGADGAARVWDAKTGGRVAVLRGPEPLLTATFSPDGARVATAGKGPARVWDVKAGREVLQLGQDDPVVSTFSAAYRPDGAQIVTAGSDGVTRVWDAKTGAQLADVRDHLVASVAVFSPDGSKSATAGIKEKVVVPGADGPGLGTLDDEVLVQIRDAVSGAKVRPIIVPAGLRNSIAFSADGQRLATAGTDGQARVWDATTGAELHALKVQRRGLRSVAFGPHPTRLLTAEEGGVARAWDLAAFDPESTLAGDGRAARLLAVSPSLDRTVVASDDKTVEVRAATGGGKVALDVGPGGAATAAFSPDGTRVATAGADGTVRVWDAATGRAVDTRPAGVAGTAVAFDPRGERVAVGTADGTVRGWDLRARAELPPVRTRPGPVRGVAYSGDGTRLVTTGEDGRARVWDAANGGEVCGLVGGFTAAALSPDGRRVATGGADGVVRVWDPASGAELYATDVVAAREGVPLPVNVVAFSADGAKLAAGTRAGRVVVWDATPMPYRAAAPPPRPAGR